MYKQVNFGDRGVNIDGEKLSHLRFVDDIAIIVDHIDDARKFLDRLIAISDKAGLKLNAAKPAQG